MNKDIISQYKTIDINELDSISLLWDKHNWSCAYDSVFTMLLGI